MSSKQKYALSAMAAFLSAGLILCCLTPFTLGGSALIAIAVFVMVTGLEVDGKRKPTS